MQHQLLYCHVRGAFALGKVSNLPGDFFSRHVRKRVTVNGDANLVSENIINGKTIFGVVGSAVVGGGSTGGNAGVETCTVQLSYDGPPDFFPTYYYTDIDFNIQSITSSSGSFIVPKNTIVAISEWSASSIGTGCTQLFYYAGLAAYQITDNTQFTFSP